jgi:hypothetical protein
MSYTGKEISKLQTAYTSIDKLEGADSQEQAPNCPYTRLKCIRYNPSKKQGVCQNHANTYVKSVRCTSLPAFVSDGWHLAVLKGGRLHV